jgi:transcription initiation factor TFIIB
VERFANELTLSVQVQNRAQQLLDSVDKSSDLIGKDPKGLAAASLYVAIRDLGRKEHRSQTQISQIAHISEVTLRNRVKNIKLAAAG